jgi:hypothetical protein
MDTPGRVAAGRLGARTAAVGAAVNCFTRWVDGRIDRFGAVVADRLLEKSGLDTVGDQFGSFLLGLNDQLKDVT